VREADERNGRSKEIKKITYFDSYERACKFEIEEQTPTNDA